MTKAKLEELGFEVLPHPPYSPDLAPSDYCLFRSLQHHIRDMEFKTFGEVQNAVEEFFSLKNPDFYSNGIFSLPQRWQDVILSKGKYLTC